MNRGYPAAILFDFDGIILESIKIKTEAFRALFKGYPSHVQTIVRYHERHAGVNRFEKFRHIFANILHRPLAEKEMQRLGKRFSQIIYKKMTACPFVPGAQPLLRSLKGQVPLFVVSATPEPELKRIIRARHLTPFFSRVYGHPVTKREAIRTLLRRLRIQKKDLLYIGDSGADWKAARQEKIRFIGRRNPDVPFAFPKSVPRIKDLFALARILHSSQ